MLYLVGIGLTKSDLPAGALDVCNKCELYADRYTTYITDERLEQISYLTTKKIKNLERSGMEEKVSEIINEAKEKDIAILIGGDPLIATTHKIIFIAAKKANVPVRVLHATSVLTVLMGESGLDFYRFGQICTISRWTEHYSPISFYETIQKNSKNNLHSIVLLDYDISSNSSLELPEAIKILQKAEDSYKGNIAKEDTKIMVMHKVTFPDEKKVLTTIKAAKELILNDGATSIIIPAKLSDIEKEIIETLY
jgi:diphthine synthase